MLLIDLNLHWTQNINVLPSKSTRLYNGRALTDGFLARTRVVWMGFQTKVCIFLAGTAGAQNMWLMSFYHEQNSHTENKAHSLQSRFQESGSSGLKLNSSRGSHDCFRLIEGMSECSGWSVIHSSLWPCGISSWPPLPVRLIWEQHQTARDNQLCPSFTTALIRLLILEAIDRQQRLQGTTGMLTGFPLSENCHCY